MTTRKNIETTLWKACDSFRGKIDSSRYKDYILAMLFVKYLNDLSKERRAEYVTTYHNRTVIEKFSYEATYDEIRDNDFNLNIPRYVDTFEEEEEVDIVAVKSEIAGIEAELAEVQAKMSEFLAELGI